MATLTIMVYDEYGDVSYSYDTREYRNYLKIFHQELLSGHLLKFQYSDESEDAYKTWYAVHDDCGWWLHITIYEANKVIEKHVVSLPWMMEA